MKKRITEYLRRTDLLLDTAGPDTDWEREKSEHLTQISFFMHERLIHLIVTALFAVLTFLVFLALMNSFSWALAALFAALLVLLVPYIMHYYLLENSVQKMYDQYDRMREASLRRTMTERGAQSKKIL
ncbi:MAG: hypothetical protein II694_07770 [Lachnospiraceae bacterium]|nr:hypothetical protein [Lachnospiraceae bacterium]